VDRLEFITLVSNALGYSGLKTLSVLTFGFRLEAEGAAVSAAGRTPLEETTSGEFVKGRNHIFVIRLGIAEVPILRPTIYAQIYVHIHIHTCIIAYIYIYIQTCI